MCACSCTSYRLCPLCVYTAGSIQDVATGYLSEPAQGFICLVFFGQRLQLDNSSRLYYVSFNMNGIHRGILQILLDIRAKIITHIYCLSEEQRPNRRAEQARKGLYGLVRDEEEIRRAHAEIVTLKSDGLFTQALKASFQPGSHAK